MTRKKADNYPSEPSMVNELLSRQHLRGTILEPCAGAGNIANGLRANGLTVVTNDIAQGSVEWECASCGTPNTTPIPSWEFEQSYIAATACVICDDANGYNRIIKKTRYNCDYYRDASRVYFWHSIRRPEWVITNPPFNQLDDILRYSLSGATVGVAMILRLTALEPSIKRVERGNILMSYADNMRFVMPFSAPRPSYTSDGKTDSVTTAWFVWDFGFSWKQEGLSCPFQFITDWKN